MEHPVCTGCRLILDQSAVIIDMNREYYILVENIHQEILWTLHNSAFVLTLKSAVKSSRQTRFVWLGVLMDEYILSTN